MDFSRAWYGFLGSKIDHFKNASFAKRSSILGGILKCWMDFPYMVLWNVVWIFVFSSRKEACFELLYPYWTFQKRFFSLLDLKSWFPLTFHKSSFSVLLNFSMKHENLCLGGSKEADLKSSFFWMKRLILHDFFLDQMDNIHIRKGELDEILPWQKRGIVSDFCSFKRTTFPFNDILCQFKETESNIYPPRFFLTWLDLTRRI